MPQYPLFIFGKDYGAFFGEVDQNELHRNVAYQVVLGQECQVTIEDDRPAKYIGDIVLIKPLAKHKIQCDGPISLIYFSPSSKFVLCYLKHLNATDISVVRDDVLPFNCRSSSGQIIDSLNNIMESPKTVLDSRLVQALGDLEGDLQNASIAQTAKACDISRSRLRALAREQLGLPLSTWLIWKKLIKANKALYSGASLSEAALLGGFSDQAHFTRSMRRMFGVTPTNALKVFS